MRQGEVYEAAITRPTIIGIVDGYFEVTPTVWHKEILWAMAQGIHVYGSASIGALRAAELHPFGMVGIGRIFADYRDCILSDDDEVAVLHGPEELGSPAVSESMVDIRATLEQAVAEGVLDCRLAAHLTEISKRLFYKERRVDAMLQLAAGRGLPPAARAKFAAWLRGKPVDTKRTDAAEMIAAVRAHLGAEVTPLTISYRFQAMGYHQAAARHSLTAKCRVSEHVPVALAAASWD